MSWEMSKGVEGGPFSGAPAAPPLYADRCTRHGNDPAPGNCGNCADVRKANQQRPKSLTLVSDTRRCLVHDETYVNVCRGCRSDEIGAESA